MTDNSLKSIFKYFLQLGMTGFGGPIALVQQMRKDLSESKNDSELDKNKISLKEFDQAFTMIKAMPGPVAFQMAVLIGNKLGKFRGGLLAAIGIITPAFIMMLVLAILYQDIVQNKFLNLAMRGAQYAVASIILIGIYNLSKNYHKKIFFWVLTILCAASFYFKLIPETILIIGSGLLIVFINQFYENKNSLFSLFFFPVFITDLEKITEIFKICFKIGAIVFGTGLVAFPFLEADFVSRLGWVDIKTFNDAVTFGQMTPGPVTIAVSFLGFKIAGLSGALAATIGIYLPSFFHMSTWFPKALNWLSKQNWINYFLFGSTAAVVGCICVTVLNMNKLDFNLYNFWIIFLTSVAVQIKWKEFSTVKTIFLGSLINTVFHIIF